TVGIFKEHKLTWRRKSRLTKRIPNQTISVEINLPIMFIACVRSNRENWTHGCELKDLDIRSYVISPVGFWFEFRFLSYASYAINRSLRLAEAALCPLFSVDNFPL